MHHLLQSSRKLLGLLGLSFSWGCDNALKLKKVEHATIFGLAILVVSALLLFENALLTPIIIIDLAVYAAVIYKFGITHDNKRLILGLLKPRDRQKLRCEPWQEI